MLYSGFVTDGVTGRGVEFINVHSDPRSSSSEALCQNYDRYVNVNAQRYRTWFMRHGIKCHRLLVKTYWRSMKKDAQWKM